MYHKEMHHKDYTMVNRFSPQVLSRSFNECIVDSEVVSSLDDISTSSSHLDEENVEKLNLSRQTDLIIYAI